MNCIRSEVSRKGCLAAFVAFGILVLFTNSTSAQLSVSLQQPPPNQLKIADLWRVTIINPTKTTYNVYLEGTAKEANAGEVVDAQTSSFSLPPGTKMVTGSTVGQIHVNSSNSKYQNILLQTGTVPAGNYTICVVVHNASGGDELASDCIDQQVENASLILISPSDEATIDDQLPLFMWTSTPALGSDATYAIKFVEVEGNQSPQAALQSNASFFQQSDMHTTTMQYPISAPRFLDDRTYAWQVTSSANGATLSESEVWSFTPRTLEAPAGLNTLVQNNLMNKGAKPIPVGPFEKAYGGTKFDHALSVQQTRDSGYIIAGYTSSFGAGSDDAFLIKTNAGGTVLWAKTYGGDGDDAFYAVKQCLDGGFIAIGYTRSFNVGNDDVYLVKTDSTGTPEFSKAIGGGGYDAGYDVVQIRDSPMGTGYAIAGVVGKGDDDDGFVAMLDNSGNPRWGSNIGGYDCDVLHAISQSGEDLMAAGYTRSYGAGDDDMFLILLNSQGEPKKEFTYGSNYLDRAYGIAKSNGNILCAIAGYSSNGTGPGMLMGQFTSDVGVVLWSSAQSAPTGISYYFGGWQQGMSVSPTSDGSFVIGGFVPGSMGNSLVGMFAFKMDGMTSQVRASELYSVALEDEISAICSTRDGGVALTGRTNLGAGNGDALLLKTDSKGALGCGDAPMPVQHPVSTLIVKEETSRLCRHGINVRDVSTIVMKAPFVETQVCPSH